MEGANALLEVLREFEAEFKQEKREFQEKLHRDLATDMKSMPAKYKESYMHRQMDAQLDVWSCKMMVKFKFALSRVLYSFVNHNQDANGYAESVAQRLICGLVDNPEENLTNQSKGEEQNGHLSEDGQLQSSTVPMKMTKYPVRDRKATKSALVTKRPSSTLSSDSEDYAVKSVKKVKLVSSTQKSEAPPPPPKVTTNKDEMAISLGFECFQLDCEQMFPTWSELNHHLWRQHHIHEYPCLLKNCNRSFPSIEICFKHMNKDHASTVVWHCAKCVQQFSEHGHFSVHYLEHHLNQYRCAFGNCPFTSGIEDTVCEHYVRCHLDTSQRRDLCPFKTIAH